MDFDVHRNGDWGSHNVVGRGRVLCRCRYKSGGRRGSPKASPEQANVHDFLGQEGKAIRYGIQDIAADAAWVSVGKDHDTSAFAVQTLRRWWQSMGQST